MNRLQLQQLAEERRADADALIAAGRWSAAYYLAGYAVECALKACIAKLTTQHDFPDKELTLKSYTHNLELLVDVAQLKSLRDIETKANPAFALSWSAVKDWDEKSRYRMWDELQARKLFNAVNDPANGVFPWITAHW